MSDRRDFSTRRAAPPRGRTDVVVVGLALLVFALALHSAWTARADLARVREEVEEARREQATTAARLQELQGRRAGSGAALASAAYLSVEAPPPRVLSALADVLPPDVRLEDVSMTYGERVALDLRVAARDVAAYDAFLARLAASSAFDEVVPGAENREGEIAAGVRLTYRPGGRP